MKYVLIVLALLVAVSGCAMLAGSTGNGEYLEGSAMGYRGPISVQVRLSEGRIAEIIIADSVEDRFVGEAAMEELIDIVIEYNSTDVDVVSGATITSKGFLDAVNNAILRYE